MFELYPHQNALLGDARNSLRTNAATVCQLGTGGGKTGLGSKFAQLCVVKGKRVLFTVHRDFLLDQTMLAFQRVGLPFGVIAPGLTPDYRAPAQIASIDTLRHRLDKVGHFDLVIVDECHHVLAPSWLAVVRHFMAKGAKVLGLTATPWRASGAALGSVFTDMVKGPSIRWLIDNGYLSKYRAFAPSTPDMKSVHLRGGDYAQNESERVMDKPTLTGDAVSTYKRLAPNARALAFCVSIVHSEHVAAQFNAAGIPARHLDGNSPKDHRREIVAAFRDGRIKILTSVEIFGEGFDCPGVDALILLRPTRSLGLHLQQIGRGLRIFPGKEHCIIADHAGNLIRNGMPDGDYEWSLDGGAERKKKDAEMVAAVRQCSECYRCYEAYRDHCPECGFVPEIKSRVIGQTEGELVEMREAEQIEMFRKKADLARRIKEAKTLADFEKIGREMGYAKGWAWFRFSAVKKYREKYRRTA